MLARIYKPAKSAMQSGKAKLGSWELVFEPAAARTPDRLMGWTLTTDTAGQVRLTFDTREEAIAFATRHGIAFELMAEEVQPRIIKAYADNFSYHRKVPWTH